MLIVDAELFVCTRKYGLSVNQVGQPLAVLAQSPYPFYIIKGYVLLQLCVDPVKDHLLVGFSLPDEVSPGDLCLLLPRGFEQFTKQAP